MLVVSAHPIPSFWGFCEFPVAGQRREITQWDLTMRMESLGDRKGFFQVPLLSRIFLQRRDSARNWAESSVWRGCQHCLVFAKYINLLLGSNCHKVLPGKLNCFLFPFVFHRHPLLPHCGLLKSLSNTIAGELSFRPGARIEDQVWTKP